MPPTYHMQLLEFRDDALQLNWFQRFFFPDRVLNVLREYQSDKPDPHLAFRVYSALSQCHGLLYWIGTLFLTGLRRFSQEMLTQTILTLSPLTEDQFILQISGEDHLPKAKSPTAPPTPNIALLNASLPPNAIPLKKPTDPASSLPLVREALQPESQLPSVPPLKKKALSPVIEQVDASSAPISAQNPSPNPKQSRPANGQPQPLSEPASARLTQSTASVLPTDRPNPPPLHIPPEASPPPLPKKTSSPQPPDSHSFLSETPTTSSSDATPTAPNSNPSHHPSPLRKKPSTPVRKPKIPVSGCCGLCR